MAHPKKQRSKRLKKFTSNIKKKKIISQVTVGNKLNNFWSKKKIKIYFKLYYQKTYNNMISKKKLEQLSQTKKLVKLIQLN